MKIILKLLYDTIDYVINFFIHSKISVQFLLLNQNQNIFKILIKQKITFLINDFSFSIKLEEKGIYHILNFS